MTSMTFRTIRFFAVLLFGLAFFVGQAGSVFADDSFDFFPESDFSGFSLETKGNLTGLSFSNDSSITPFLGANFSLEEDLPADTTFVPDGSSLLPSQKKDYLLGAEIDCCLSDDTRLTLNYNWNPTNVPAFIDGMSDKLNPSDERFNISVGLNVMF